MLELVECILGLVLVARIREVELAERILGQGLVGRMLGLELVERILELELVGHTQVVAEGEKLEQNRLELVRVVVVVVVG